MADISRSTINLPAEVSDEIMQKTQEQSAIMRLARQIRLPGRGVTIPVITGDPTAEWVGETESKPVSNATLATKTMTPYKLAVIETFSTEFARDNAALYDALIARVPAALGMKIDNTVVGGTAPGSNFDTFASGVTAVDIGTKPYEGLVTAYSNIAENGGIMNGIVLSPQGQSVIMTAVDGNNRPLFGTVEGGSGNVILDSPVVQSKGVYVNGTPKVVGVAGDWTQAMYGTVEGVVMSITDAASVTYKDGSETKTINLWQNNMMAARIEIEFGFVCDKASFNTLTKA